MDFIHIEKNATRMVLPSWVLICMDSMIVKVLWLKMASLFWFGTVGKAADCCFSGDVFALFAMVMTVKKYFVQSWHKNNG